VVKCAEVLTFFDTLQSDMYDLPKGSQQPVPRLVKTAAA
jgi:hypothetical protein